ncbi:MAG TPA: glycerol-3-phosphate 1-O-acyltransferase PlsY [Ktedonobacteraceae bacterium]|nr:glycerol-3-phosphate 1-O-acyltransferase PlsY [Ktedonobacteraceae bacterium]
MTIILAQLVLIAIIAYLWGSIPSGYWMGKLLRGKDFDIRDYGSHKTGATNVRRTLGNVPAAVVVVVDLSKGVGPVLLATLIPFFYISGWGPTVAGVAALLGHIFPIFIGFRGGRGVMTGAGAILVTSPLTILIAAVTTISTIAISRYVSLGSIVGALTSIICGIVFYFVGRDNPTFFGHISLAQMILLVVVPGLVILFHYDNIGRLLAGKERKLGQKEVVAPSPNTSSDVQA